MPRARCPSYREVLPTPTSALSGANFEQIPSIYLSIGSGFLTPQRLLFVLGQVQPASMSSEAAISPASPSPASQARATTAPRYQTKLPYHSHPVSVRSAAEPRQRRDLDLDEDDEPLSDTAVDTHTAAGSGSSQTLPILPKDNDDIGSEYAASSDEEGPVLARAKHSRESARLRLRGVRAPSETPRTHVALASHAI